MDNDILKLLGTEYSLSIANHRNGEYRVKISNSRNQHAYRVLSLTNSTDSTNSTNNANLPLNKKQKIRNRVQNYMLFLAIKACISDLKQLQLTIIAMG